MYPPAIEEFFFLKIKNILRYLSNENLSFWMLCFYLFFEYTRPQAIFPALKIIPWAEFFILAAIFGAVIDKSVTWVSNPVNKYVIFLSIAIYASSLTAYFPEISSANYINFYSWVVVYFLTINIVNTKQRFYVFILVLIICSAKIAIGTSIIWAERGFAFTKWGLMGPNGYFNNSGELSILMLTLFPISFKLYQLLKNKISRLERWLLIIFMLTPILTILGASSRGSQLALLVQLLVLFRKNIFKFKSFLLVGLLFLSLLYILPDEQLERFNRISHDRSSQQRLLYLKNGVDMLKEHPMLGVGFFNFAEYYQQHYPKDILYQRAQQPHNIIIQVGTDAGIIGLASFGMMLLLPFWQKKKQLSLKDDESFLYDVNSAILLGNFGFVVAGQFVTVAYYPFIWIGTSLAVASHELIFKKNQT